MFCDVVEQPRRYGCATYTEHRIWNGCSCQSITTPSSIGSQWHYCCACDAQQSEVRRRHLLFFLVDHRRMRVCVMSAMAVDAGAQKNNTVSCLRVRISAPENRRLPARPLLFPLCFHFFKCTATTAAVTNRRGQRPVMPRALLPASPHSSQICVNKTNALESFYLCMYSLARRRGVHDVVHVLDTKIGQSRRW